MDVADLIESLSRYPSDMRVLKASDEEGNSFHQIYEVDMLLSDNPLDHEPDIVHEDDVIAGEYDWQRGREMTVDDYTKVVVIW